MTIGKPAGNKLNSRETESHGHRTSPVYADWCGVVRDRHGPFWPTGRGPLYPAPRHSRPDGRGLLRTDKHYVRRMKILFFSEKETASKGSGWYRTGENIIYSRTSICTSHRTAQSDIPLYQLKWEMTFPHADDLCYMAYCYPYSYTELKSDLNALLERADENHLNKGTVRCEILCQTRAGNSCFLVTITDPEIPDSDKIAAVLTARVHPGETNSSWVILGLLRLLTGTSKEAVALRRQFVFRIIPMLNPDGVILGNYRWVLVR
ncbi:uncharacterized protein DEA37_0007295 [Paragonimus westermani]|uniref:Peptidase M14 domain-containing protein n=1 Tax=Paragonimus westermani TaxID=34504 RepID=A0A5J4NXY0_9TREM|nr:uncharacterized protein DEA37_0007295 [Paragonimus westermani]